MTADVRSYRVAIAPLPAEEGGGFLATAPDLDGCMSDGATPEEALAQLYDAIGCWLAIDAERAAPPPVRRFA